MGVLVGGLHTLADVDHVNLSLVPEEIVLAQVCMDQSTFRVHTMHDLWCKMGRRRR